MENIDLNPNNPVRRAIAIKNEAAKEKFTRVFGSLSAYVLEFIKGDGYLELLEAVNSFYIKDDKERLLKSNIFTIDFNNPIELQKLRDTRNVFSGREMLYDELKKLKDAIEEIRLI